MTLDEFNATGWTAGMEAVYHGDGLKHEVTSCDFGEQLVGLRGVIGNAQEETSWVRCENVTLVNPFEGLRDGI